MNVLKKMKEETVDYLSLNWLSVRFTKLQQYPLLRLVKVLFSFSCK